MKKNYIFLFLSLFCHTLFAGTFYGKLDNGSKVTIKTSIPEELEKGIRPVSTLVDTIRESYYQELWNDLNDLEIIISYENEEFYFTINMKEADKGHFFYSGVFGGSEYIRLYWNIHDWFVSLYDEDLKASVCDINFRHKLTLITENGKLSCELSDDGDVSECNLEIEGKSYPFRWDKIEKVRNGVYRLPEPFYNKIKKSWNTSFYMYFLFGEYESLDDVKGPKYFTRLKDREKNIELFWRAIENKDFDKVLEIASKERIDCYWKNDDQDVIDYLTEAKAPKNVFYQFLRNESGNSIARAVYYRRTGYLEKVLKELIDEGLIEDGKYYPF